MSARARKSPASPATPSAQLIESASEAAAELLKAMANPQRLRVLCLRVEREMSVGEINALVPLSQSALSQHLAVLREKELVQTRREAQNVFYALMPGPAAQVMHTLHGIYCAPAAAPASRKRAGRS